MFTIIMFALSLLFCGGVAGRLTPLTVIPHNKPGDLVLWVKLKKHDEIVSRLSRTETVVLSDHIREIVGKVYGVPCEMVVDDFHIDFGEDREGHQA